MAQTEKKYAPSAWKWVAGLMLAAAGMAALIAVYVYLNSPR